MHCRRLRLRPTVKRSWQCTYYPRWRSKTGSTNNLQL